MARNDVAGIVSGAGLLMGIGTEFARAVGAQGGTPEDIHRLATPEGRETIDQWARLTVTEPLGSKMLPLKVDYWTPLEELLAAGDYARSDWEMASANFLSAHKYRSELEATLIDDHSKLEPNTWTSDEPTFNLIESMGMRPGNMHDLLSFGAKYPQLVEQASIVGLGAYSPHYGHNHGVVGCVRPNPDDEGGRIAFLAEIGASDWSRGCKFLAVRKSLGRITA